MFRYVSWVLNYPSDTKEIGVVQNIKIVVVHSCIVRDHLAPCLPDMCAEWGDEYVRM